jgi:hypothetical protein
MSNDAFDNAFDILRIIADPKKSEAALKEYRDLVQKNAALAKQASDAHAAAEKKLDEAHEAEARGRAMAVGAAAKETGMIDRAMRLDERNREIDERHRDLTKREDGHREAVARKEVELGRRERAVAVLEAERAKLIEDRKQLDEQMERARNFLKV